MKPAVKWTIRRGRRTFTIDVLAVRDHVAAGTLTEADRALIERVLPGVIAAIPKESPDPE